MTSFNRARFIIMQMVHFNLTDALLKTNSVYVPTVESHNIEKNFRKL